MGAGADACARREMASGVLPRVWLERRRRLGSSGPEAAQADRALETCDGKGDAPSGSDVRDRFVEYSREVNGVCTHGPNMTEHTFEKKGEPIRASEWRGGPGRSTSEGRYRRKTAARTWGRERTGQSSDKAGGDPGPR